MIWQKEAISWEQIDTMVLDIDGVLVDVYDSFRQAICQGVAFYLQEIAGMGEIQVLPEETGLFKKAGGFNNDWDLALAMILFYLKKPTDNLTVYTEKLAAAGGGLLAVEQLCQIALDPEMRQTVARICQELYAGETYFSRLYGDQPRYFPGKKSLLLEEKILVDVEKLLATGKRLAILTGRNWKEAELILERIGLLPYLKREETLTDDDGWRKPNPQALDWLAQRMGTKRGIFIGDTLDDLRTTKGTAQRWLSGIVLSSGDKAGKTLFTSAGADLIAPDINTLLDFFWQGED